MRRLFCWWQGELAANQTTAWPCRKDAARAPLGLTATKLAGRPGARWPAEAARPIMEAGLVVSRRRP